MNRLTQLMFDYLTIKEQADSLYAQAKNLEKDIKAAYESIREQCGRTGKTVDELEAEQ